MGTSLELTFWYLCDLSLTPILILTPLLPHSLCVFGVPRVKPQGSYKWESINQPKNKYFSDPRAITHCERAGDWKSEAEVGSILILAPWRCLPACASVPIPLLSRALGGNSVAAWLPWALTPALLLLRVRVILSCKKNPVTTQIKNKKGRKEECCCQVWRPQAWLEIRYDMPQVTNNMLPPLTEKWAGLFSHFTNLLWSTYHMSDPGKLRKNWTQTQPLKTSQRCRGDQ